MDSLPAILVLLFPLCGAVAASVLGPTVLKDRTHWCAILGVLGSVVCSFVVLSQACKSGFSGATLDLYEWISSGAVTIGQAAAHSSFNINLRIDALTAIMLVTVTSISCLVIVYSHDYMRHGGHPERGYERFFAFLSLFVFSMCVLVLAGNLLLLYLGWEAVGLCSYLLIGFNYPRPAAAAAAKKAFLVNRIGDFGFGLGILLIYLKCGSLDYDDVLSAAGIAKLAGSEHVVAVLLLCGAVGKSAQLPLHVWLPDAMEGPSPVSALIHAATMVTAGVYMVARCGPIFVQDQAVMTIVAAIGGVTALFAATIALAQYDVKRILAYSTISQLGYMFLGLGVYAADAAVFHLVTHAFFKALLFLAAGSVMHALGGVIDVREFGGLRRVLPWTFAAFLIGSAALAGFPLLAGFYSKDMIIHRALQIHPLLGWLAVLTAALTAFYTFRMVFLAFWGSLRLPAGVHAHESGPWMIGPLLVLCVGAGAAGFLFEHRLPEFLANVVRPFADASVGMEHHVSHRLVAILSGLVAIGAIAAAAWMYVVCPQVPSTLRQSWYKWFTLLHNKYYLDEAYDVAFVRPLRKVAHFCYGFDRLVIDGLVWLVTAVPRMTGFMLRGLQHGSLQGYGVTMIASFGVLLFLAFYLSETAAP